MPAFQRHVGCGFQPTVDDQLRNSRVKRAGMLFPCHHRQVAQVGTHSGGGLAVPYRLDVLLVGEFFRAANAMHENQMIEGTPRGRVTQDGHEGTEAGAGGEHPEIVAGRELIDGQEAVAQLLDQHGVADLERRHATGELAAGNQDHQEFQEIVVRSGHH